MDNKFEQEFKKKIKYHDELLTQYVTFKKAKKSYFISRMKSFKDLYKQFKAQNLDEQELITRMNKAFGIIRYRIKKEGVKINDDNESIE